MASNSNSPSVLRRHCFHALCILICLSACEPEADLTKTFIIRQHAHYSTPRLVESLQSTRLVFEARFDESAIYDLGDLASQSNKNKLLGFADCNSQHHENSARFAWQWFNNRLEIYSYCYVNGQRIEGFLGEVPLNTFVRYEIERTDHRYIFKLNGTIESSVPRGRTCETGVYYKLWPYFGGSIPAPHDIRIDIKPVF